MNLTVAILLSAIAIQTPGEPESIDALEREMARMVNVEREARGLNALEFNAPLAVVARQHSQTMMSSGKFSHDADGRSMEERIRKAVTNVCRFGENITKHYSIEYAIGDLMGSPGHRGNLLDPKFTGIGIGITKGEDGFLYITQDFFAHCKKRRVRSKPQER
jgi:uncharacterized protein YkwD